MDDIDLDIETLRVIAPTFWEVKAHHQLSDTEMRDVESCAKLLVLENPFDAERGAKRNPPIDRPAFIQKALSLAFNLVLKNEELNVAEQAQNQAEASKIFTAEMLRQEQKPQAVAWREPGISMSVVLNENIGSYDHVFMDPNGMAAELELAPYEAKFTSVSPWGCYLDQPYYIPHFRLEPRYTVRDSNDDEYGVLATRKHHRKQGRRYQFTEKELGAKTARQIDAMYQTFTECLMELLPHYLREFGFWSLDPKYWGILSDFNKKGLSPIEIQRNRRITRDQYYSYLKVLERRGWMQVYSTKRKRPVLLYFPILDRNKQLYSNLGNLQSKDPEGLMRLIACKIDRELYKSHTSDEVISKELIRCKKDALKMCVDQQFHKEWDGKLKAFICDFVRMPLPLGADLADLESKFKLLSQDDRLRIFCEAKRRQVSLWEVLSEDLNAVFADILAHENELEAESGISLKELVRQICDVHSWGVEDNALTLPEHGTREMN